MHVDIHSLRRQKMTQIEHKKKMKKCHYDTPYINVLDVITNSSFLFNTF